MRARIRQNLPLYGHTRLSEYNQAVAFKNSYRSADKLCAFPDLPSLAFPCLPLFCEMTRAFEKGGTDVSPCDWFACLL
jgi:hypothetical protein